MGWKKTGQKRMLAFARFCHYCGKTLADDDRTLDHIVPRARGGTNALINLVPCCFTDNHEKADSLPDCKCEKCVGAVMYYLGLQVAQDWLATHPRA